MNMFWNILGIVSSIITLLFVLTATISVLVYCLILCYKIFIKHEYVKIENKDQINCQNCQNYKKCKQLNNSFEFSEYGDKWAQHCEDYLSK